VHLAPETYWSRGFNAVEVKLSVLALRIIQVVLLMHRPLPYAPKIGMVEGKTMTAHEKHSPVAAGNIYAKANEVVVKITGDDTRQPFEAVEENCKLRFQSLAHYHIKA